MMATPKQKAEKLRLEGDVLYGENRLLKGMCCFLFAGFLILGLVCASFGVGVSLVFGLFGVSLALFAPSKAFWMSSSCVCVTRSNSKL